MSSKDRLVENSTTYQQGNPVTSKIQLVSNILGAALFLVFAAILLANGQVIGGIVMLVIAGVAFGAVYIIRLGRRRS